MSGRVSKTKMKTNHFTSGSDTTTTQPATLSECMQVISLWSLIAVIRCQILNQVRFLKIKRALIQTRKISLQKTIYTGLRLRTILLNFFNKLDHN